MTKQYENESPHSNPEIIRRIGVLGDLWKPSMSEEVTNALYEAVMNPETLPIEIQMLQLGIILKKYDPMDQTNRNPI